MNATTRPIEKGGKTSSGHPMKVKWAKAQGFPIPMPKDEPERIANLKRYEVLDTPPEKSFDNITFLAALICNTPIALVSLVDSNRQWFKAKFGVKVSETPRDISMCTHAIMHPELFIVRDTTKDPRFAQSPLVTRSPKIRFYAGAPIMSPEKHILGTLCVMDHVPRLLTPEQTQALRALSHQVMIQLVMRRELLELKRVSR
jgi:GAF domain-containing protein